MEFKKIWSPNKRTGNKPLLLVIHYTAGGLGGTVDTFLNLDRKVSSHYIIDTDGTIIQMVKEKDIAFHAGKSYWGEYKNLNNKSIGIELVNWGQLYKDSHGIIRRWTGSKHSGRYHYINRHYWDHYSFVQMGVLVKLTRAILTRWPKLEIVRHSDISPGRKFDCGPALDFERYLMEVYP